MLVFQKKHSQNTLEPHSTETCQLYIVNPILVCDPFNDDLRTSEDLNLVYMQFMNQSKEQLWTIKFNKIISAFTKSNFELLPMILW